MKYMKKVLYPGSFDPITYGHMDVVNQALKIYDTVIIGVLKNSSKVNSLFSIDERKRLIEKIYKDKPNVIVISMDDNIAAVDVAIENDCNTMIRGLRDVTDFAAEMQLAATNLIISNNKINTVAFFASPTKTTISSTTVKELFRLNKDIARFVHPIVEEAIKNKYKEV